MLDQAIPYILNIISMVIGIILGSYLTQHLLTRKIEKMFQKYTKKYGITELRVKGILEKLAEFFEVEI
jgi:uncharacterized protein YneF (UPF0154 family)